MADTDQVLKLAAIIREVDGSHSKGAAALAELILDHPSFHQCCNAPAPPADGEVAEKVWPPSVAASCHEAAMSALSGSPEQQLLAAAGNTIENLWQELHQTVPVVPTPPADGEVAELEALLRAVAADLDFDDRGDDAGRCYRAAELLQRQALVPVPVSERLPGPEDCDDRGRCWWLVPQSWPCLYLMKTDSEIAAAVATHWLPAHSLPLPEASE